MDFIVDNYFWFIVGGILVLMIIIGYIAERTDFGRKPFSKKTKKVEKEVSDNTEEVVEEVSAPVEVSEDNITLDEFMANDNVAEIEIPNELLDNTNNDITGLAQEDNAEFSEENPGEIIEDPMPELDIPEVTNTEEKESVENISEVVQDDMAADDSEDDVWKF